MALERRRAERKGSISKRLVTETLLKVDAVKVHLKDAEKAYPREGPPNGVACPELSHARPTHSEVEGPEKRAIDEVTLPVFHDPGQSRSTSRRETGHGRGSAITELGSRR